MTISNITSEPTNGATFAYAGIAVMAHDGATYSSLATAWAAHTYVGAIDAGTGFTTTLPGEPTRDAIQAAVNGGEEFLATYTASTDPATIEGTFLEFLRESLWEALTGLEFTGEAAYSSGGLPPFYSVCAVALDASQEAVIGWHLPYAVGSISNGIQQAVGGTGGIGQIAGKFSGSNDPISGKKYGLFLPNGY